MCAVSNYVAPHLTTSVHRLTTRPATGWLISSLSFQVFAAALRAIITKGNLHVAGTSWAVKPGHGHHHEKPNSFTSKERNSGPFQDWSIQFVVKECTQKKKTST